MFEQAVQSIINEWLPAFFNPQKRIYWGYLASALFIALLWLSLYRRLSIRRSLKTIFSRESWLSRSARADYLVMLLNSAIMILLSPRLLSQTAVAYLLFELLHELFSGRAVIQSSLPTWVIPFAFTLFLFIVDDLARYVLHRLLHQVPWLWAFHKVHHTATSLNPFTVFRTHPVEAILFSLRGALVQGFCIAVFFFFFGQQVNLLSVLGASIFTVAFNLLGSNLRHSNISIGLWKPLERIFISPAQHQIHHSTAPQHIDKNYGVVLAVWDYWFNSHCFSQKNQQLEYGVPGNHVKQHSLRDLYWQPLVDAWQHFQRHLPEFKRSIVKGQQLNI